MDENAAYIANLTKSLALTESASGGMPNYNAKGASGEKGAYQWMPGNFESAAKQYGYDPSDFSAANQNKVAYAQVAALSKQGLKPWEIASDWNSGSPDNWQNHSGVNSEGVAYDTPAYVKRFQLNYQKVVGGQNQASGTAPQTDPSPQGSPNPLDTSTWGLSPVEQDAMTIGANTLVTPEQYALQEGTKTGALMPASAAQSAPVGGNAQQYGAAVGANMLDLLKVFPNILSSGWNAGKGVVNSVLHPIQTAEGIISDPLSLIPEAYKQLAGGVVAAGGDVIKGNGWQAVADGMSALDKARIAFEDDPVGNYLLGKGLTSTVEGAADIASDPLGKSSDSIVGKAKAVASDPVGSIQGQFSKIGNMFKSRGIQGMTEAVQAATDRKTANISKLADLKDVYAGLDEKLEYAQQVKSQIDVTQKAIDDDNEKLDAWANTAAASVKDITTSQSFKDPKAIADTLVNYFNKSKDQTDAAYEATLRGKNSEGTPLTEGAISDLNDAIIKANETMDKESAGDPEVAEHMDSMMSELDAQVKKGNIDANNIQTFFNRWSRKLPQGLDGKTQAAFYAIKDSVYKAQEDTLKATGKSNLVGDLQKTRSQYAKINLSSTSKLVDSLKDDPDKLLTEITKPANWTDAKKSLGAQTIAYIQNSLTSKILKEAQNEDGSFNPKEIQKGINKYGAALKTDHHGMLNENIKALNLSKNIDKMGVNAGDIINKVGAIKDMNKLGDLANATGLSPKDLGSAYMRQAIDKAYSDTKLTTDSARLQSFLSDFDKVGGKSTNSIAIKQAVFGKETVDLLNSIRDPKTGELAAFKELEGFKKKGIGQRVSNALAASIFAVLHHGLIAAGFAAKAVGPDEDLPIAKTFVPKSGIMKDAANAVHTVTGPAAVAGEAEQQQQPMPPEQQTPDEQPNQ